MTPLFSGELVYYFKVNESTFKRNNVFLLTVKKSETENALLLNKLLLTFFFFSENYAKTCVNLETSRQKRHTRRLSAMLGLLTIHVVR